MSFLIPCPNCGNRSVYEFRFGGEVQAPPTSAAPPGDWQKHRFNRVNAAGVQAEWWFHRSGCRQWMQAVRNTVSNEVLESFLPGDKQE
ncbi:MAG TPA: sarcosine oxidase subunit delta [Terriglobales bacterium]|jgi:heterotetrameric sarcosine oxidase delta subunit|nr:sarcosine oxidase subunit delta [Terriglobales bacterium]